MIKRKIEHENNKQKLAQQNSRQELLKIKRQEIIEKKEILKQQQSIQKQQEELLQQKIQQQEIMKEIVTPLNQDEEIIQQIKKQQQQEENLQQKIKQQQKQQQQEQQQQQKQEEKVMDIFNNNLNFIENKVNIDVAVLCQEYTTIEKMDNDHILNLDEIEITKEVFQTIFYPYCENFGLNITNINNNKLLIPYISFLPEHRTMDGKKFFLLEKIISNLENDLNVSRNCFTMETLVELSNEITNLHSFCNLNFHSVLSSLTWKNILEIVKNYKMADTNNNIINPLIPICVISIIFKTPTVGVKNTIVRFNYRITDI
jgi:flagellar motor protein MotB